jgi:hypothetical protein
MFNESLPSNDRGLHTQIHRASRLKTKKLLEAVIPLQSDSKLCTEDKWKEGKCNYLAVAQQWPSSLYFTALFRLSGVMSHVCLYGIFWLYYSGREQGDRISLILSK